jgi:transposase
VRGPKPTIAISRCASLSAPNRRARRIAIVAVARRLVIALWRYLKDGVIPEGAELKMR